MNATSPTLPLPLRPTPRRGEARSFRQWPRQPSETTEEIPWRQNEDLAPAWAVTGLTLAAVATLLALAILG